MRFMSVSINAAPADTSVLFNHALALSRGGRTNQALDAYRRAKEAGISRFGVHMMPGSCVTDADYFPYVVGLLMDIVGRVSRELRISFEFIDLGHQRSELATNLSHGQQQWLEIAMAVALQPSVLLLDEPTAGMSPEETFKTGELVKKLNASGMTVVVIEHDMAFVRQIAKRVTVLHYGEIFDEGSLDEIVRNEDVVRIYLGKV